MHLRPCRRFSWRVPEKCISSLRKHSGGTEAIAQGLADALLEKWVVSGAANFFSAVRWLHVRHLLRLQDRWKKKRSDTLARIGPRLCKHDCVCAIHPCRPSQYPSQYYLLLKTHLLAQREHVLSVSKDEVLRVAVAGVVASLPDLASFVARDPVSSIKSRSVCAIHPLRRSRAPKRRSIVPHSGAVAEGLS